MIMRLSAEGGQFVLDRDTFGPAILADMKAMYGGTTTQQRHFRGAYQRYASNDRLVHATRGMAGYPVDVVALGIDRLDQPQQAQRLAALQAYRAKSGVAIIDVSVEVPGLGAYREWDRLRDPRNPSRDFYAQPAPASENDPLLRRQDNLLRDLITIRTAPPGAAQDALINAAIAEQDALEAQLPSSPAPDSVTRFYASGADFPTAARIITRGYNELTHPTGENPRVTVANALGVASLDHLDSAWEAAMRAETPVAAGTLMLEHLSQQ